MTLVPFDRIVADHRAQPRIITNTELVAQYVREMAEGDEFPPIVVFQDGDQYFIGDGFHRFYAYQGLGLAEVDCDVRPGGLRAAILHSCSANIHGEPRTNEDKRRAVTTLFSDPLVSIDPETGKPLSDNKIAQICKVSQPFVGKMRALTSNVISERAYVTKHGTVSTMNTSRIGANSPPRREPTVDRYQDHFPQASTPSAAPDVRPSPPSPASNPLFLEIENDRVHTPIDEIVRQFGRLPSPEEAARAYPTLLRHCMSADRARQVSDWFALFADQYSALYGPSAHHCGSTSGFPRPSPRLASLKRLDAAWAAAEPHERAAFLSGLGRDLRTNDDQVCGEPAAGARTSSRG